jgi:hypothetical protein
MSNRSVSLSHAVRSDGKQNYVRLAARASSARAIDERVFQISKLSPGQERPLVIASCGKTSAKRLLAALAIQGELEHYRVTAVFVNPVLPGFEYLA